LQNLYILNKQLNKQPASRSPLPKNELMPLALAMGKKRDLRL